MRRAYVPFRGTHARVQPYAESVRRAYLSVSSMADVQVTCSPSWVIEPTVEFRGVQGRSPRRRETLLLAATWHGSGQTCRNSIAGRGWSWPLVRQLFCLYDGCLTNGGRVRLSSARQVIRRLPGLFMSSAAGWSSTFTRRSSRLPQYPTPPRYADARKEVPDGLSHARTG